MRKIFIILMIIIGLSYALPSPSEIAAEVNAGHYQKAQMLLQEVLKQDPNSAKAHYMLSQTYYLEGNYVKAKNELNIAKKLDPTLSFANKGYLKNYEYEIGKSLKVKKGTFGGAMILFLIGILLILGAGFLFVSSKMNKKNNEDIKTKLMEELTAYLENVEKIKTKLSIDLVSLKEDDPAKKDLSSRLDELENIRTSMMDLLQKLKNNQIQDIQGAYVYFENLKDKLKEVATGVKNTYETHEDLKNLQNTYTPPQSYQNTPQTPNIFGGFSFMDMLGMMAMGSLMGSIFTGGLGSGPTIINNNYEETNQDISQDIPQDTPDQGIDFAGGDDWSNDIDTSDNNSWE